MTVTEAKLFGVPVRIVEDKFLPETVKDKDAIVAMVCRRHAAWQTAADRVIHRTAGGEAAECRSYMNSTLHAGGVAVAKEFVIALQRARRRQPGLRGSRNVDPL